MRFARGYTTFLLRISAHPSAPASRDRDTYPRMYPYVSDMYRECILCVMYLRGKIHCILNVSRMYPKCILKKDTYPYM